MIVDIPDESSLMDIQEQLGSLMSKVNKMKATNQTDKPSATLEVATEEQIRDIQEQLAATANDPNLTIVTGGSAKAELERRACSHPEIWPDGFYLYEKTLHFVFGGHMKIEPPKSEKDQGREYSWYTLYRVRDKCAYESSMGRVWTTPIPLDFGEVIKVYPNVLENLSELIERRDVETRRLLSCKKALEERAAAKI